MRKREETGLLMHQLTTGIVDMAIQFLVSQSTTTRHYIYIYLICETTIGYTV